MRKVIFSSGPGVQTHGQTENTDESRGERVTNLRHEKLTYELRGLIFEVRQKLKTGWPEEVYHQGLLQLLLDRDIPVHSKPRKAIVHRGYEVHVFECDLIVWDLIILELKVLPFSTFAAGHYAQIICSSKAITC